MQGCDGWLEGHIILLFAYFEQARLSEAVNGMVGELGFVCVVLSL